MWRWGVVTLVGTVGMAVVEGWRGKSVYLGGLEHGHGHGYYGGSHGD